MKKDKILELVIGGIIIFSVGIFIGYKLNSGAIKNIQGYLFNASGFATDPNATDCNATDSNATDSNATDSNATDSNATDSNATDSNATDSNATSSNASINDNILILSSFYLKTTTSKTGEKIYVNLQTQGTTNTGASVSFKSTKGYTFTTSIYSINNNPYIIIPNNILPDTYNVTDLLLTGLNSDYTTFTKHYGQNGNFNYTFSSKLIISSENKTNIKLNSFTLKTNKANISDKVYFDIQTSEKLTNLKLEFKGSNNTFTVYAASLNNNPYFEIPSNSTEGKYILTSLTLISNDNTVIYTNNGNNGTLKYVFNSDLEITNNSNKKLVYNNEDIDTTVISKLYESDKNSEIAINANENSFISSELFNIIKGTNRTLKINNNDNELIFKGNDIKEAKTIDVNTKVYLTEVNNNINEIVKKGIIIDFPDNGSLPGNALVKIKNNDDIKKVLDSKVNVYYYNDKTNKFRLISRGITLTEDYYEFNISHTSSYVLTNEEIDKKYLETNENVVNFQKSNKVNLLLIGAGVLVIIGTTCLIIFIKRKNK